MSCQTMIEKMEKLPASSQLELEKEIKDKVSNILVKVQKNGVSLKELSGYQKLLARKKRQEEGKWLNILSILAGVLSVTIPLVVYYELYTVEGFSRAWLRWNNFDLYSEPCTIEMPPYVHDMFRPPVDCSMCSSVTQVDRVDKIDSVTFEERYAYSGRPLVVADGAHNWTAIEAFSLDFFKEIYSEESPVLNNDRNCQFFPYATEFRSLQEVFNMSEVRQRKPWYIGWSNCDPSAANVLRAYYSTPYFLPKEAEPSKTDWIFMGSPGYGAHMHIDHVGNPSWQAQIKGKKTWFLQPPPECYRACRSMEVTVNPGEMIVLDTNRWYHSTLIVSDDMSITIGSEFD